MAYDERHVTSVNSKRIKINIWYVNIMEIIIESRFEIWYVNLTNLMSL